MSRKTLSITTMVLMTVSMLQAKSIQKIDASELRTRQASETLKDIERRAAVVAREAEEAQLAGHNERVSWQSHTAYLTTIKADLNRIGREVKALEAEQSSLAPWEREALIATTPVLKDAAENTDRAIQTLNADPDHVWMSGTYSSYAQKIASDDKQASKTLRNFAKLQKEQRQEMHTRGLLSSETGY